jgi:PiT family inorganic phosphate transporter
MMGVAMSLGMQSSGNTGFPMWLMITCALAISLGTFLGGKRIIKSVAMDMVDIEKYQGLAASGTTVITLFMSSITGMPVSTTHTKTTAIMGVGAEERVRAVKWDLAKNMVLTWVLTFPGCGLLAFLFTEAALLVS